MKIRRFETINVVPFIDIMLVLLVIVLTTATFVAKGIIPVDLTRATSAKPLSEQKELIVTITQEEKFFFNDKAVEEGSLESELLQFNEQTPIMINCDKHASFEPFVKLMDLLKQHHYTQIGILTKQ